MKKEKLLKKYFGYDEFRPLQGEAIDTILEGKDLLMILPTGGGKSLCYQLPSLLMDGVTVVISPLLALMHDQVAALHSYGIPAAMLSSMQDMEESQTIINDLTSGKIKLLFVAPERFASEYFISLLHRVRINFFVIDEAHCLSEWGHEFRENYRELSLLRRLFPDVSIAAFTATATGQVRDDIISQLGLREPNTIQGTIFRPNLTIHIEHRVKEGKEQLLSFLGAHRGQPGIVYTLSRRSTETIALFLESKGYRAKPYHAGLSPETKKKTYDDFISDRIDIVVATIAFGMGIDKSNIRFVVHMHRPKTVESFYQEIGRAGRDGLEAKSLLLDSVHDTLLQKRFIDDLPETPYKTYAYAKIEKFTSFIDSSVCRHRSIADYFGDTIEECRDKCDNCLNPPAVSVDITTPARKLLSSIMRTEQKFGMHYIVDILLGSQAARVLENAHDKLSVYGIGREFSRAQWLTVANRLLELKALEINEYKVYRLTQQGADILKGLATIDLDSDRLKTKREYAKADIFTDSADEQLFNALRALRREIAIDEDIPPYLVFSDKTLRDLVSALPASREEMLEIYGIGEQKYEKYGEKFLDLLGTLRQRDDIP